MTADAAHPTLSWNVAHDVSQVLEYHFMLNALLAGSVVAVVAGLVGWVMVLRREAFAGHTLSMMAFPGASAAALAGVAAAWGYFLFCAAGAAAIGMRMQGRRVSWSEQSAGIGAVQALALAAGFLFVSLYGGVLGDLDSLLFGDLLGVSDGEVLLLAVVGVGVLLALGALGRPLLFASLDADVAAARGVPVRAVSLGLPARARPGRRRYQPGDRCAAGVRAARCAGGERPGADGTPAGELAADGRARPAGGLAGTGHRLFLRLPGRLLHRHGGICDLRAGTAARATARARAREHTTDASVSEEPIGVIA